MKSPAQYLFRLVVVLLITAGLLTACHKTNNGSGSTTANNGIVEVVYNNFSLYLFYNALTVTNYSDTLNKPGPFTVLAPSNAAFQAAGYASAVNILTSGGDSMRTMMPYLILHSRLAIDSMPLAFNRVLTASNGKPLYLTHWVNQRDTAFVVNGIRISTLSKPASNGLINISDALIYPSVFSDVQMAVSGDPNLSFFNAALIQSGFYSTLRSGGPYTLFAPANSAFMAIGIPSVDSIYKMDPARLKAFVQAYVVNDRRFIYDYILKGEVTTNTYTETMADGSNVTINLVPNSSQPRRFTGVTLTPAGTGSVIAVTKSNVLADNGVVHSINSLLNPNF